MDWKYYFTIFTTILIAKLGDKTQLATFVFATNQVSNLWLVIISASLALIMSTVLAVLAGNFLNSYVDPRVVERIAGVLFIVLGVYMLIAR